MSFCKTNFAVMFPGQGSQYVGMGKTLYDNFPIAKEIFKESEEILNFPISSLCFKGDIQELTKTNNAQPALLITSYIMYRIYIKEKGLVPIALLGHSLGEITALTCSGAINFTDALNIVKKRGIYMANCGEENPGSMLAIMSDKVGIIEKLCKEVSTKLDIVEVANYNSFNQTVVSGTVNALAVLKEKLKEETLRCIELKVSAPFHSSLMQNAAVEFSKELENYQYNDINLPVFSNVTGKQYIGKDNIKQNLTSQLTSPVQWVKAVKELSKNDINLFVEVGPKNVLKNLNKNICPDIKSISLGVEEDITEFNNLIS